MLAKCLESVFGTGGRVSARIGQEGRYEFSVDLNQQNEWECQYFSNYWHYADFSMFLLPAMASLSGSN